MEYFELHPADGQKLMDFSPLFFIEKILKVLIEQEKGKVENFLNTKNNNKKFKFSIGEDNFEYIYKQIRECWHATYQALAINKAYGIRYNLMISDSPDVILTNKENCIPVEIYEAFEFLQQERDQINIKEEVKKLWDKKSKKSYGDETRLLIVNRKKSINASFNVSEYIRQVQKYDWPFASIGLCLFNEKEGHAFFDVSMGIDPLRPPMINFDIKNDGSFLY